MYQSPSRIYKAYSFWWYWHWYLCRGHRPTGTPVGFWLTHYWSCTILRGTRTLLLENRNQQRGMRNLSLPDDDCPTIIQLVFYFFSHLRKWQRGFGNQTPIRNSAGGRQNDPLVFCRAHSGLNYLYRLEYPFPFPYDVKCFQFVSNPDAST